MLTKWTRTNNADNLYLVWFYLICVEFMECCSWATSKCVFIAACVVIFEAFDRVRCDLKKKISLYFLSTCTTMTTMIIMLGPRFCCWIDTYMERCDFGHERTERKFVFVRACLTLKLLIDCMCSIRCEVIISHPLRTFTHRMYVCKCTTMVVRWWFGVWLRWINKTMWWPGQTASAFALLCAWL